ncbi:MAG: hypothetical protein IPJ07_25450 [Acidobacteria bacterium]|nr:hypothetical protein [Acidobacteriota bacterium]
MKIGNDAGWNPAQCIAVCRVELQPPNGIEAFDSCGDPLVSDSVGSVVDWGYQPVGEPVEEVEPALSLGICPGDFGRSPSNVVASADPPSTASGRLNHGSLDSIGV